MVNQTTRRSLRGSASRRRCFSKTNKSRLRAALSFYFTHSCARAHNVRPQRCLRGCFPEVSAGKKKQKRVNGEACAVHDEDVAWMHVDARPEIQPKKQPPRGASANTVGGGGIKGTAGHAPRTYPKASVVVTRCGIGE